MQGEISDIVGRSDPIIHRCRLHLHRKDADATSINENWDLTYVDCHESVLDSVPFAGSR